MSNRAIALATIAHLGAPAGALGAKAAASGDIRGTPSGFDATATLRDDGRAARVTGPVQCTKGRRLRIDVTLTQRSTGALARGTWRGTCKGTSQDWTLRSARIVGVARLARGTAQACAAAVALDATRATDATQWCERVRLVEGGGSRGSARSGS